VAHPSWSDAWKGLGALVAVGIYLLPVRVQARGLKALWHRRAVVAAVTWALAAVHAVPLAEHLPRFLSSGQWADGWRGVGAAFAVVWFATPIRHQTAFLSAIQRAVHASQWAPAQAPKAG
jgi:hypothetical protein